MLQTVLELNNYGANITENKAVCNHFHVHVLSLFVCRQEMWRESAWSQTADCF